MRIERHVEDGCCATGGGSARACCESFPIRSARLIEVDVGVDHSGENQQLSCIDFFTGRPAQVFANCHEFSASNSDVLLTATHDQIEIIHDKNDEIRMTND